MLNIINAALPYILKILGAVIGFLLIKLSNKINKFINSQQNKETINALIEHTVNYVEQVYKTIKGQDKLNAAKDKIIKLFNEKGIKLSDDEIEILIESAVKTMNDKKGV